MHFSDRITLRAVANSIDTKGFNVETHTDTVVWADKITASQNEFYSAGANGITVSAVFMVHPEEYAGQTEILFETVEYNVERTFQKDKGNIGLVCSTKAG